MKICFAGAGVAALGSGLCSSSGVLAREGDGDAANVQPGNGYVPGYLALAENGELERREAEFWKKMERCSLCPRMCGVNRMDGRMGICSSDHTFKVASAEISFAEESVTVARGGTGSIFMSNCNLLCVFCQNWEINHKGRGRPATHEELADIMLALQRRGANNIGIVTPTHVVPHIVSALRIAADRGLSIPFLYNSSGYETLEVLQLLDGIVDIYIPDFKFQDSVIAASFLQHAQDYAHHTAIAIKEMHRQVGIPDVVDGIANSGLITRHLVLPENLGGADKFALWVAAEIGKDAHVNIMGQFRPMFRSRYHPPLDRRITQEEFNQAMSWAREAGLRNFY